MQPLPIVKDFDVLEHLPVRVVARGSQCMRAQLAFERAKETLLGSVIPAVAGSPRRRTTPRGPNGESARVRIPAKVATRSNPKRPAIPIETGHPFVGAKRRWCDDILHNT